MQSAERRDAHPLSISERAVMTLHELSGRSGGYNLRCALRVGHAARNDLIDRSVRTLLERHEMLRSRFVVDGTGFYRVVVEAPDASLRRHELNVGNPLERDAWLARRSLEPFSLESECPIRFDLAEFRKSGAADRVLLITSHHVATDYASIQLLVAELEEIYQGFAAGRGAPRLPQVAEPARRVQREASLLQSPTADRARTFWRSELHDLPAPLQLPGANPRPQRASYEGLELRTRLDESTTDQVRRTARALGVTPYVFTLTAYAVTLSTLAHTRELVLGTTVDSDGHRLRFGGVGYYVNTLPLRLRVDLSLSVAAAVSNSYRVFTRALRHGSLPFAAIVEALGVPRRADVLPVCQAMMTWLSFAPEFLQPAEPGRLLTEVLALSGLQPAGVTHDLVLSIEDRDATLACSWAFCSEILSPEIVEAIAARFQALLTRFAQDPAQRLADAARSVSSQPSHVVRQFVEL